MPNAAVISPSVGAPSPSQPGPAGDMKHLHGRYKSFFDPQHHATVEKWYNDPATLQHQRRNMRTLVKMITEFDVAAAKQKLRATDNADTINANAIFDQHNPQLLSSDAADSACRWLAYATPSQKQMYRDTFGRICPPSLFSSRRQYSDDFSMTNKIVPTEQRNTKPKALKGMDTFRKPSEVITSETLVIGRHPTVTGTNFVWKTGHQLAQNVQQRAHDATFQGAPWGDYGKESTSNHTQWLTKSGEDYLLTAYNDVPERPFQNYNENFCTELYKNAKHKAKTEKLRAEVQMARAASGLDADPTLGDGLVFNPDGTLKSTVNVSTTKRGAAGWSQSPSVTLSKDGPRPQSILDIATAQLAVTQRKYHPKKHFATPPDSANTAAMSGPPPASAPVAGGNTTTGDATVVRPPNAANKATSSWQNEDGSLRDDFKEVAGRIRQTQYPLLHTGLKRRKMWMKQYHSRD